jgi:hypothetical protein
MKLNFTSFPNPYKRYRKNKDIRHKSELAGSLSELDSFGLHELEFRNLLTES